MTIECSFQSGGNGLSIATFNGTSWKVEPLRPNTLSGTPSVVSLDGRRYYFFTGVDGNVQCIVHDQPDVWHDPVTLVSSPDSHPLNALGSPRAQYYPNSPPVGIVRLWCRANDSSVVELTCFRDWMIDFAWQRVATTGVSGSDIAVVPGWDWDLALYEGVGDAGADGSLLWWVYDYPLPPAKPVFPPGSISGAPSCAVSGDQSMIYMFYAGAGDQRNSLHYCTRPFDPSDKTDWSQGWSQESFVPGVQLSGSPAAVFTDAGKLWVFYRGVDGLLHYVQVDDQGAVDTLVKDEDGNTVPLADSPCVTVL